MQRTCSMIRSAVPDDIPALQNIYDLWEMSYVCDYVDIEKAVCKLQEKAVLVCTHGHEDDIIRGFAILDCYLESIEIEMVVVDPIWRRGGAGLELIKHAIGLGRSRRAVNMIFSSVPAELLEMQCLLRAAEIPAIEIAYDLGSEHFVFELQY